MILVKLTREERQHVTKATVTLASSRTWSSSQTSQREQKVDLACFNLDYDNADPVLSIKQLLNHFHISSKTVSSVSLNHSHAI